MGVGRGLAFGPRRGYGGHVVPWHVSPASRGADVAHLRRADVIHVRCVIAVAPRGADGATAGRTDVITLQSVSVLNRPHVEVVDLRRTIRVDLRCAGDMHV